MSPETLFLSNCDPISWAKMAKNAFFRVFLNRKSQLDFLIRSWKQKKMFVFDNKTFYAFILKSSAGS